MITCPRCHHQNPERLSACELCNAPLRAQELDGGEDILAFDDLGPIGYDLDESLEPTSELRGQVEEIQFDVDEPELPESDVTSGFEDIDMTASTESSDAPSGLARLLHDALASGGGHGGGEAPPNGPYAQIPRTGTEEIAVPKVASISDQELSDFLLDALSETDAPPSIDAPPPRKGLEEAGLFKMPGRPSVRDGARGITMDVPGASALAGEGLSQNSNGAQRQVTEPSPRAVGVQCSNCGGFNPEGMFYCVYCGFSLENSQDEEAALSLDAEGDLAIGAVDCPSCGASNPTDNRFCGSCGYKVGGTGAVAEVAEIDPRVASGAIRATSASRKASPWDVRLISINEDGSDGLEIPLDFVKTVVGRTGDTRFPTDAFLSPKHASLTIEHGELFIEDLYSLNGTFVKLRDEVPLSPGDVFLMGRQVLRFEKFEQTITPKARSSDGTRYMGSPPPGGQFKLLQVGIGGVIQNVYCIPESGAVLGREKGDIIFPRDKFMSGRHAQIYPREDSTYCLVDLNSSNGTWIKIWEKTPLQDGDFIFMGQQLFRIEVNGLINPRRAGSQN